ncbi:MAG TPA: DUF1501 domain-containing protein [Vicinamibacterales bacterium]|nr:DUF1501 domain-containing protein [Vicinamibacterales bacterium]
MLSAFSPIRDDRRTLVVLFLRGGADGLALVPPVGDDAYHRARPRIAVAARDAIRLDDRFGLNPRMAPLESLYREGQLAVVPACGSEDDTRSHFAAQDFMEHGGADVGGGWLGRWLRQRGSAGGGALTALAFGTAVPESLRGAPSATALRAFSDLGLGAAAERLTPHLASLYAADVMLADAAHDALDALNRLASLHESSYLPANGAIYGNDDLAVELKRLAQLIKTDLGLEAACLDVPGWDTHFLQATSMEPLMARLASGLSAFATDLGSRLASTSIVVMTEFGRRVVENSSLGTDHGRGSVMFVIGGGVRGGVHGRWPGLDDDALVGPGDVRVEQNFRDVLAAVLARHGNFRADLVFPGYRVQPIPV